MKTFIYIISLIFLLASCKGKIKVTGNSSSEIQDTLPAELAEPIESGEALLTDDVFGEVIALKGKHLTTNTIFKIRETEMIIKDSFLIMKNLNPDNQFMVFSLPGLRLIKSFGLSGKGPGEFQYPHLFPAEHPGALCYVVELTSSKIYSINKDLTLSEVAHQPFKTDKKYDDKQLFSFSNNHYYYAGHTSNGRAIFEVSLNGDTVIKKQVYDLAFSKDLRNWGNYIGDFGANKARGRLVYAYKYVKRLAFMDTSAQNIRILNFEKIQEQKKELISQLGPENVTHYWGMCAQPKYVYTLYSGRTPIEVGRELKKDACYIYLEQFDWNGKPVRKFKLDHWGYFCVDEKHNQLYIASVNDDEPLYVYNLPPL